MKTKRKPLLLSAALGLAAVAAILVYWLAAPPDDTGVVKEEGLRTVIVAVDGKPAILPAVAARQCGDSPACRNGENGINVVVLKRGRIPNHPVRAFVESDTDCAPDAYGISHCTNRLRLPNGEKLEVRHDHNMQIHPCLSPGETVQLQGDSTA